MRVSVIISTMNRGAKVAPCLNSIVASLEQAKLTEAEIVVVDNNSTDNTVELVTAWKASCPYPVQLVVETKKGCSAARNRGVAISTGELLVFTDHDCQLTPNYISDLLRYDAADTELVMRGGSVVLGDPADLPLTIKKVSHTLSWKRPMDVAGEGTLLGSLIGCNMAMRRAVVDKIGPFDEKMGPGTGCPAGEDTDYYYRAYLAGILLEMVPDMVIEHHHGRRNKGDTGKLLGNYAMGNGALCLKYLFIYPNFSRHFLWDVKKFLISLFKPNPITGIYAEMPRGKLLKLTLIGAWRYGLSRAKNYWSK